MPPTQNPTAFPVDVEPTPTDILRGAALYIERHGHHKGDFFADNDNGTAEVFPPACVLGAMRIAITGDTRADGLDTALFKWAACLFGTHLELLEGQDVYELIDDAETVIKTLGDWNDDEDRTVDEVVRALRTAAETGEISQHVHVDYPHQPGTLYDCLPCEAQCFCNDDFICVHCASTLGGTE